MGRSPSLCDLTSLSLSFLLSVHSPLPGLTVWLDLICETLLNILFIVLLGAMPPPFSLSTNICGLLTCCLSSSSLSKFVGSSRTRINVLSHVFSQCPVWGSERGRCAREGDEDGTQTHRNDSEFTERLSTSTPSIITGQGRVTVGSQGSSG